MLVSYVDRHQSLPQLQSRPHGTRLVSTMRTLGRWWFCQKEHGLVSPNRRNLSMPRFRCHARCSGSRLKTTVLAFHFGVLTLTANEKWPALFNWGAPQLNIGRRFRRSTPVTGFAPRDRTFDGSGLEPLHARSIPNCRALSQNRMYLRI